MHTKTSQTLKHTSGMIEGGNKMFQFFFLLKNAFKIVIVVSRIGNGFFDQLVAIGLCTVGEQKFYGFNLLRYDRIVESGVAKRVSNKVWITASVDQNFHCINSFVVCCLCNCVSFQLQLKHTTIRGVDPNKPKNGGAVNCQWFWYNCFIYNLCSTFGLGSHLHTRYNHCALEYTVLCLDRYRHTPSMFLRGTFYFFQKNLFSFTFSTLTFPLLVQYYG